jgi:hypothetical protein
MKTFYRLLLFQSLIIGICHAQKFELDGFVFKQGDILFQDYDCGDLCKAIKKVTKSVKKKSLSHVGLTYILHDSAYVIEAIGENVHLTKLDKFIERSVDQNGNNKILVERVKPEFQRLIAPVIKFALTKLGIPYDQEFIYNNGKYYCSELIYDACLFANDSVPFFELQPMTFKDPATGKTIDAWRNYYEQLNKPIPEGKPGCNPGGISMSKKLNIVKSFY